jgi:hypothetical protein
MINEQTANATLGGSGREENILTLLCCGDTEAAIRIRNEIDVSLFASEHYRYIATQVYGFLDKYGHPPGKEHLADLLEEILNGQDTTKAAIYKNIVKNMHDLIKTIDREYVLNSLDKFIHDRRLMQGFLKVGRMFQETARVDEMTLTR